MSIECVAGLPDCSIQNVLGCADYNEEYIDMKGNNLLLSGSFGMMAIMAFYIGANDVANAFGTSVGSRAISTRSACILAGLADWLGAVTLGYGVSTTVGTGVAKLNDPTCWACGYCDSLMDVYAVSMFGALIGATIFLAAATLLGMPVSTTHTVIGGVAGVTILGVGGSCLNFSFKGIGGIAATWVISPVLSGIIGAILYFITDYLIVSSKRPLRNALMSLPILYSIVIFTITFLILMKSKPTKSIAIENMLYISLGISICVGIGTHLFLVPYVKSSLPSRYANNVILNYQHNTIPVMGMPTMDIDPESSKYADIRTTAGGDLFDKYDGVESRLSEMSARDCDFWLEHNLLTPLQKDVMFVFRYLIVLTATLESYAHGANDTANATGPLSAIYNTWDKGLDSCTNRETPLWIMVIAGGCLFLGINIQGYKVMETIGKRISTVNMHRGFCMEFASAITVIIATMLDIPVSTTHCQVGAVFIVSWAALGHKMVSFKVMGKIALSWIATLPCAGLVGMLFSAIFRAMIKQ